MLLLQAFWRVSIAFQIHFQVTQSVSSTLRGRNGSCPCESKVSQQNEIFGRELNGEKSYRVEEFCRNTNWGLIKILCIDFPFI